MSVNRNTDIPRDLEDCVFMLETLDRIEGRKLDNRAKLEGCIRFLKSLAPETIGHPEMRRI